MRHSPIRAGRARRASFLAGLACLFVAGFAAAAIRADPPATGGIATTTGSTTTDTGATTDTTAATTDTGTTDMGTTTATGTNSATTTQTFVTTRPSTTAPATTSSLPAATLPQAAKRGAVPKPVPKEHGKHKKKMKKGDLPLKVTPALGLSGYVFPVVGHADYVDTYGAFRGDVPGNWHHGDDLFAPLGTAVVAVASGTVNQVGWEPIGGWRLWLSDRLDNQFYYAHLSGYAPVVLHSGRVRAGEVLGFIGNTGDAFTTSPHLHFEVHPRTLLGLGYGGAVDPTTYLDHWPHLLHVRAPRPVLPPLPAGAARREVKFVFRELLAARRLIKDAPKLSQRPRIQMPGAVIPSPSPPPEQLQREALATVERHHVHALSLPMAALVVLSLPALLALLLCGESAGPRIARRLSRQATEPADG